ncbi:MULTISPECIES: YcxB family protein [Bacillaceae]|uniref:YcxB family protein n=1 Tax=Evansella alkalicola TaxID=745819 RepID=A0ABS6JUV3_9BACI|nr:MULTISPECIES: YcxB family protein [Bacillaceae]MBU9722366.1 YcxB family protein [Bacillus alkalicola]
MSNKKELSIKGTVRLEDFTKYNDYHSKKTTNAYFFLFFFCYWAILLLLELLMQDNFLFYIPKWVLALIMSLITIYSVKKSIKKRAIKEYESDQRIKNEISYTFSNEGINQHAGLSNNFYEWREIYLAKEHEKMFLLYTSKHKAIILPKRFFELNDDMDLFKMIVSNNIVESSKMKLK